MPSLFRRYALEAVLNCSAPLFRGLQFRSACFKLGSTIALAASN